MKAKINKKTLLGKNYNKGFVWLNRYSDSAHTDKLGRWARTGYYNGFMICWITGFKKEDGKLVDKKEVNFCNYFVCHLLFPCSSNQGGDVKDFEDICEAKIYAQEMFLDFKRLINK